MKKLITLLVIFILSNMVLAQNMNFELEENYVNNYGSNSDYFGQTPLFKLTSNFIDNQNNREEIKSLPPSLDPTKFAYGFLYFNGNNDNTSVFERNIVLLVENYMTSEPILYLDKNGNLDFTDDGSPISLSKDELILKLKNGNNKNSAFHYKLKKNSISPENDNRMMNLLVAKNPNAQIVSTKYWFINQRLSLKVSKETVDGKPITIILYDANADGIYSFDPNDYGDRIVIVDKEIDEIEDLTKYTRIGEPIDHNAVFLLHGKKYNVVELNVEGTKLSLIETDKRAKVKTDIGTNISNLKISLLNQKIIETDFLLREGKYLLLDFGATWCGGCIMQEPTIKKLYKTKKVNVVGIFDDKTTEIVTKYKKKHHIEWPVALITPELQSKFLINSYPNYVLISPQGKVVMIEFNSENIINYINKT